MLERSDAGGADRRRGREAVGRGDHVVVEKADRRLFPVDRTSRGRKEFCRSFQRSKKSNRTMPGVYISYPFCAQKCTYCNFASGVSAARTGSAVSGSAASGKSQTVELPWTPETIYLGGGTPSQLDPACAGSFVAADPGASSVRSGSKPRWRPRPGTHHTRESRGVARSRHQSRQPGRAIFCPAGNRAHRAETHGGDRRARNRDPARGRHRGRSIST